MAEATEKRRTREELWTPRTVAWYIRANARSDYAERVLGVAEELVADCRTALDVGAGFGALALPLAARLERVTALEPSPAMAEGLRREAVRLGRGNITVVEAAWGKAELPPHDLIVCAHVGPLLRPGAPFLAEVGRHARRGVILVVDAPGREDKFFFSELYPRLLGRPYDHRCTGKETVAALRELGLVPRVATVEYSSDQPLDSLEEACDFWMAYMKLAGDEPRAYLRDFLAPRLVPEGRGWLAPFRKRCLVAWWRSTPV